MSIIAVLGFRKRQVGLWILSRMRETDNLGSQASCGVFSVVTNHDHSGTASSTNYHKQSALRSNLRCSNVKLARKIFWGVTIVNWQFFHFTLPLTPGTLYFFYFCIWMKLYKAEIRERVVGNLYNRSLLTLNLWSNLLVKSHEYPVMTTVMTSPHLCFVSSCFVESQYYDWFLYLETVPHWKWFGLSLLLITWFVCAVASRN